MFKPAVILALAALGLCACSAEGDLDGNLDIGGTDPAYWTFQIDYPHGKAIILLLGHASPALPPPLNLKGQGGSVLTT